MSFSIRSFLAGRGQSRDDAGAAVSSHARFSSGARPVIRWIKGDGLDDVVTRSAIAQATRLFGPDVDYCLCTHGLGAERVRRVLAWATQPVEWLPLSPELNPGLAGQLLSAGCDPDRFGYWWKWFPERVRPNAPEWVLDGDMVITGKPEWFEAWVSGADRLRVSQDDRWVAHELYGSYLDEVDLERRLYSGLVSLPPGLRYMDAMLALFARKPLNAGHDGQLDMSEQGVIAATFDRLDAIPIPLNEFPMARAFEDFIDYGLLGDRQRGWGYHFGHAFRRENPHFVRLVAEGVIDSRPHPPPPAERFAWLGNRGQWGREGWSMHPHCVERIASVAKDFAGRRVLEIGTSRGFLSAVIASLGCRLTTVDHEDRGARENLAGLGVEIMIGDAASALDRDPRDFALITVDLHGNRVADWRRLWPVLKRRLSPGGTAILYNSHLWKIPEWKDETGLLWLANTGLPGFAVETFEDPPPGMLVCRAL